jgi:hypothetical protein
LALDHDDDESDRAHQDGQAYEASQ